MKNAILIHGWTKKDEWDDLSFPTPSNNHWFPWLTKRLMVNGTHAISLEMPNSYVPNYEIWKRELERFEVNEHTTLVGHSCGAGFIVRWLGERNNIRANKVILVAPSLGFSWEDRSFFDFEIDPGILRRTNSATIISAQNDNDSTQKAVEIYLKELSGIKHVELEEGGHFTKNDLGSEEFPELLEEALR